jgi:hypothetical protein
MDVHFVYIKKYLNLSENKRNYFPLFILQPVGLEKFFFTTLTLAAFDSCAKYYCACTENGGSLDARCGQFTVSEYLAKDFPHLQPDKITVIRPRNLLLDLKAGGGPCQCDNYMVTV